MNSKIGIRIMEYNEEFLFYFFYSFFGILLKNPEQNFITSLHLIRTGSKNQSMESEEVVDSVTSCIRIANVS